MPRVWSKLAWARAVRHCQYTVSRKAWSRKARIVDILGANNGDLACEAREADRALFRDLVATERNAHRVVFCARIRLAIKNERHGEDAPGLKTTSRETTRLGTRRPPQLSA